MIQRTVILMRRGYEYVRHNPQILTTLLLLVVIPTAFFVSGQKFLDIARNNQDRLQKDRIGLLQDVFSTIIRTTSEGDVSIQNELTRIAQLNSDIVDFKVVIEDGPYLRVVASLRVNDIGSFIESPDMYRTANVDPHSSFIIPDAVDGIRYWNSYRLVEVSGGETYYIFTRSSLAQTDAQFSRGIMEAYFWLTGLLLVVFALIIRHVRLIDYAALYAETKRSNQAKDMFTNMIAHELRAPLTAMRGYASMILERTDVPHEIRTYTEHIGEASDRLVLIVNDLLDVARIHSGKLSFAPADTDIQNIITSVLEAMQVSAQEKGIQLRQDTPTQALNLYIDSKRFHQALTNLVSNSIKYTKAGSITLSFEDRVDMVEIRVKDTGTGISAENQKNLFAPFFRVADVEVDNTIGTGLGMWITKQLIELMGGTIAVESIKGVGTHVVLKFSKATFLKTPPLSTASK